MPHKIELQLTDRIWHTVRSAFCATALLSLPVLPSVALAQDDATTTDSEMGTESSDEMAAESEGASEMAAESESSEEMSGDTTGEDEMSGDGEGEMDHEAMVAAGMEVWKDRGGCFNCHGAFGEGGEGGHFPAGPSLRRTMLDPESMKEIIACGIPGTPMPYNAEGAYDTYACFGVEGEEPMEGAVPGASLSVEEIDNLMAYLEENVVGKRRITKDECINYYGDPEAPECLSYR